MKLLYSMVIAICFIFITTTMYGTEKTMHHVHHDYGMKQANISLNIASFKLSKDISDKTLKRKMRGMAAMSIIGIISLAGLMPASIAVGFVLVFNNIMISYHLALIQPIIFAIPFIALGTPFTIYGPIKYFKLKKLAKERGIL